MLLKLKSCLITMFLIVALSPMVRVYARPLSVSDEDRDNVFVCNRSPWYENCGPYIDPFDLPGEVAESYMEYIDQVLANEWPGDAGIEALKAGSIAIRTFADREPGCGSKMPWGYCPYATVCIPVEYNGSQSYWLNNELHQNPIQADHSAARSATDAMQLKRHDG